MICDPSRIRLPFILSPAAFVLPNRDSLSLGERIMAYLPRCADTEVEVRKVAIQVCVEVADLLFFICYSSIFLCNAPFPTLSGCNMTHMEGKSMRLVS